MEQRGPDDWLLPHVCHFKDAVMVIDADTASIKLDRLLVRTRFSSAYGANATEAGLYGWSPPIER